MCSVVNYIFSNNILCPFVFIVPAFMMKFDVIDESVKALLYFMKLEEKVMNELNFYQIIQQFENARDHLGSQLNMRYLLIKDRDTVYEHAFNDYNGLCDVRSISKTVLALTTGIIIEKSQKGEYAPFDEETFVFPLLKDSVKITNLQNLEYLNQIKIKHCMTHSIGFRDVLMMRDDIRYIDPDTYLDMIFNHPIIQKPGESYLYSNAGFYVLSALLQHIIKEDLIQFIQRELFNPLHITDFKWEKYGKYCAGATKLWLRANDLLHIGELILTKGKVKDKHIISTSWIEKMLTCYYLTPEHDLSHRVFRQYGYGYGVWLTDTDISFGYGTDGQTLVMVPSKQMIIVTMAEQQNVTPINRIVDQIIKEA